MPTASVPVPVSVSVPVADPLCISQTEFQPSNVCSSDSEPSPTSDSYTVPGSTMKETHIFTPSKPTAGDPTISTLVPVVDTIAAINSRSDIPSSDCDQFSGDSIVIKENVVKKEYRDVEYEPNKLTASSDDFSEFQFVQPPVAVPNHATANEPNSNLTNSSLSISNFQPISMGYVPDKNGLDTIPNENYLNHFDNSMKSAPSVGHSQTIADTFSNHNSNGNALSNGSRSEFEFYSISEHYPSQSNAGNISNESKSFGYATNPMDIFSLSSIDSSHFHSSSSSSSSLSHATKTKKSNEITINSSPPVFQQPSHVKSNMNSNTFLGNSSICLQPQPASMQSAKYQPQMTTPNYNALTIQWPEPGINSDQLEQLERRFSTHSTDAKNEQIEQKTNETAAADDEWSDFVSVVQPQTPITNILNKNLMKQQQQNNDEDDWSEFVSSTPHAIQAFNPSQNSMPTDSTTNYVPFQSGTSQSSSYIIHPNPLRHQTVCDASNHESHAYQSAHQSIAPSIISLPDLRFVAPKSLVNMPKRSIAKK